MKYLIMKTNIQSILYVKSISRKKNIAYCSYTKNLNEFLVEVIISDRVRIFNKEEKAIEFQNQIEKKADVYQQKIDRARELMSEANAEYMQYFTGKKKFEKYAKRRNSIVLPRFGRGTGKTHVGKNC